VLNLPFFLIEGNASLAFFRAETDERGQMHINRFMGGVYLRPEGETEQAWKGMAIVNPRGSLREFTRDLYLKGCFLRINWISSAAGEIMANRDEFHVTSDSSALLEINMRWKQMLEDFVEEFKGSEFSWFNERLAGVHSHWPREINWLCTDDVGSEDQAALSWGKVEFPSISRGEFGYLERSNRNQLIIDKKPLHVIPLISENRADRGFNGYSGLGWNPVSLPPDRVVFKREYPYGLAPIWMRRPRANSSKGHLECPFPPGWKKLCGARFGWYGGYEIHATVWNSANPLVKQATTLGWEWCKGTFRSSIDPVPHRNELLSNPEKAVCWLLLCLSSDNSKIWEGIPERDPDLIPRLMEMLYPAKKSSFDELMFWVQETGNDSRLRLVDQTQWKAVHGEVLEKCLPKVQDAWRIRHSGP